MLFIAPGFHTWHHLKIRLQGFELPKRHGCSFAMRTASSYDPFAPRRSEDESFYDCVLKTTIDRRVELRRSVGD
jgi:hypothetical protein